MTRRDDLLRGAMTADDRLDDLTRARMWSSIEGRVAAPRPVAQRRWGIALALAAGVIAVGVTLIVVRPGGSAGRQLVAPEQTTLTAELGPHTHAALVGSAGGPATLDVVGAAGEATTVKLETGTLLAEFTGGSGRSLRVEAPGLTVDIVGTLFAVEVKDGGAVTCVSVAHGKVRATRGDGSVREVGGGERLCTGDDAGEAVKAIEPAVQKALVQHESSLVATEEPATSDQRPATSAQRPTPSISVTPLPEPASPVAVPASPVAVAASPVAAHVSAPPIAESHRNPSTLPPDYSAPTVSTREPSTLPHEAPPPPSQAPPVQQQPQSPPPQQQHEPNDSDRYHEAEQALARHDSDAADRALARLISDFPSSELVDQAIYDRARLAYQRHAWSEARRLLDQLTARPTSPLTEPARYLTCRIAVEVKDGDASRCVADYRTAYPQSPHDLELLGVLAQLQHAAGGCSAATATVGELATRYPNSKLAAAWRTRCPAEAAR
nr:FecR domain-containing protein [Kofleriaceae bacterium]